MKKNLDNPIVQRALKAFMFTKLSELCTFYKISSQNLNGMINRGTLIKLIESELIKRRINVEWIKTGQGEMKIVPEAPCGPNADDIAELRKDIIRLQGYIIEMGGEIGEIKNRMIDTALSGDLSHLRKLGGSG